ncbi:MAG: 4-(cytidine 5'-diphospho)-2-C-methyl-D-erythritol kinase [Planctomycetaceae bacterium]|nr:4-(cytidine 5'-diphospho)-2-C-methyl-D-erythritol kinase [Planctomycetaceae bacterium]
MTIKASSPAKLNVFLEILSRRGDGFHELETVMLRTSLCDTITFALRSDPDINLHLHEDSCRISADAFPLNESNLIVRAARLMQKQTGCTSGADITVSKQIPAEAGLAGGSSNAATTIRQLNSLWGTSLSEDALHALAEQLGSDINFLLSGHRAAVCHGRGEKVEPIALKGEFWFVAMKPVQGNRTQDVFQNSTVPETPMSAKTVGNALTAGDPLSLRQHCFNRLTSAAREVNPSMARMMDDVKQICQNSVFMSGSGSTCFVVVDDEFAANSLQAKLTLETDFRTWVLKC